MVQDMQIAAKITVTNQNTAATVGSGEVPVYATPMMIALMEKATYVLAKSWVDAHQTTVGTEVHVKHLAATPIGLTVEAVATLVEKSKKILVFSVIARDEAGIIGEGTITRAIVTRDSFINKAQKKAGG